MRSALPSLPIDKPMHYHVTPRTVGVVHVVIVVIAF
jgi:hypothetical protein